MKLLVLRRGWDDAREFIVQRRKVEVPTVHSELLPGKIGYLQLQQFGERSADEFVAALDEFEKQEMEALILDLRDNPGGFLDKAVRIVDQFVAGELPIVTQQGRGDEEGRKPELATRPDAFTRPNYPMAVIINYRSASASEVVAGALQDFGRATIIGQRTFGKGSVQRLIPLSSDANSFLGGEGRLRLTIQYYFLPLGRCVHTIRDENGNVVEKGGVEPDIAVEMTKVPIWRMDEMEKFRGNELVLAYVHEHFEAISELFANGDGNDPSRYPGFDDLYDALETPAPREDLRRVLRFHLQRRLEDKKGRELVDFQEDRQLQRAILELLEKIGKKAGDYPRYATFVDVEEEAETSPK